MVKKETRRTLGIWKEDKWLRFIEIPTLPNKKTKRFNVLSKCSKLVIGTISWYPHWRYYCFFPEEWTVYSDRCLISISKFITKLNIMHKKEVKPNPS